MLAIETEKVNSTNFETVNLEDALNNVKNEITSIEDLQLIAESIPVGFFTNNIFALSNNIEKINHPQVMLALQKNLEKAIGKYEEKTAEEATEKDSGTETPVVVPKILEEEAEIEKSAPKIKETEANETKKAAKHVTKDFKKAERDAEKAAKLLEKQESKQHNKLKKKNVKQHNKLKKKKKIRN